MFVFIAELNFWTFICDFTVLVLMFDIFSAGSCLLGVNEYMSKSVNQEKYTLINAYTHQRIYPTCSTTVESSLQIGVFFCKTKPILRLRSGQVLKCKLFEIKRLWQKGIILVSRKQSQFKAKTNPNEANPSTTLRTCF